MGVEFIGTCVNLKCNDLEAYDATEVSISYSTFRKIVGKEIIAELNAANGVKLSKDWSLRFGKGLWKGAPCVCMHHSAVHHLWRYDTQLKAETFRRKDTAASPSWVMQVPVISSVHLPPEERMKLFDTMRSSVDLPEDELVDIGGRIVATDLNDISSTEVLDAFPVLETLCAKFQGMGYRYLRIFDGGCICTDLQKWS